MEIIDASHLQAENDQLKSKIFHSKLIVSSTWGFQAMAFLYLYTFLASSVAPSNCLLLDEESLLVLVKLWLNLMFQDLANRYSISLSSASTKMDRSHVC